MQEKYQNKARNLLLTWLKSNNISVSKFSRKLDIDYSLVQKWLSGLTRPSLQNAIKIKELTNGYINCEDWVEGKLRKNKQKPLPTQPESHSE